MNNQDFLKGTLSTLILSLLRENGRMYGYEICQKTGLLSENRIQLTEGAIYPCLHKLEKSGLIFSTKEKVNGRTRKYYHLTPEKTEEATARIDALEFFLQDMFKIIKPV